VPTSGSLPHGEITTQLGNSEIVTLTVNSTGLTGGVYTATVPVTSNGGDASIDVTMVILQLPETIEPGDTITEAEASPFVEFTAQFYRSTTGGTAKCTVEILPSLGQASGKVLPDSIYSVEYDAKELDEDNEASFEIPWGVFEPGVSYVWLIGDRDLGEYYLPGGGEVKPAPEPLWSYPSGEFQVERVPAAPVVGVPEKEAFLDSMPDEIGTTTGAYVFFDETTGETMLALPGNATSITVETINMEDEDVDVPEGPAVDYMFDIRIEGVYPHGSAVDFIILVPGSFSGSIWKYKPAEEEWVPFDFVNLGTIQTTDEVPLTYTQLQITLTDGGEWDSDGLENGIIADPLGVSVFSGYDNVSGGSGGCFIATAAYGSPFERHVQILREFRDRYLMTGVAGRAFVRWYYIHSPRYARIIAGNEVLRTVARVALTPLYGLAYTVVNGLLPYIMLAFGLFLLVLRRRAKKAVVTLLAVGILLGVASTSFAAETNHFKVAPAEEYTVMVPTTRTVGQKKLAVDLFYSYADNPLQGELGGTEIDLIENQSLLNAGITMGLSEYMQVSLTIPYVFNQSTEAPIEKDGFGDIILGGKYRLRESETGNIAIAPYVQLPTGNEDAGLGMDENWGAGIRGIYDRKINENTLFTANLGYAYQPSEDLAQIEIQHSILFGVGIVYKIPDTPSYIAGELYGRSEELFDTESTPVEALFSYGYRYQNTSFVIGGGVEVIDGYGSSSWRLFTGVRLGL